MLESGKGDVPTVKADDPAQDPAYELQRQWQAGQAPDVHDFVALAGALPVGRLVEVLRVDQQQRWLRGERVPTESYLERYPVLSGEGEHGLDLVYEEFLLRDRLGEQPRLEEFIQRFPQQAEALRRQVEVYRALQADELGGLGQITGYEILGELGRGGMGVVFKARSRFPARVVALKMLASGAYAHAKELARFRAEIEAVAGLQHPNIVPVYEVGESEGRPYFTMELLSGGSLARRQAGKPEPSPRKAAELVQTLARAMYAAHQQRVVHRDLKPSNVLLTADDVPKIADFGLATVIEKEEGQTWTGTVLGTPAYMAPEQAGGGTKRIGPAVDIYALGAVLYELLTGRPPFYGETPHATITQVLSEEPVPPRRLWPGVPLDLETVCLKCLQKDPRKRYPTALALAEDLERFLQGRPIHARPTPLWERTLKWVKRRPAAAALITVSGLAALALLVGGWAHNYQLQQRNQELQLAVQRAERNEEHALKAAETMVRDVAEVVAPIAGTNCEKVQKILADAADIYDPLVKETNSSRACKGKGRSLNDQVDVLLEMNDSESALASAQAALALFQNLTDREPENSSYRSELAHSHHQLARVFERRGNLRAAEANYRQAQAQYERLSASDAANAECQSSLSQNGFRLGYVLLILGSDAEAEELYRRSFEIAERLARHDPKDQQYQERLAMAHANMGELLDQQGKDAQARAELEAARKLIEADSANTRWQLDWCRVNKTLGTIYGREEPEQAKACYEKSLQMAHVFCATNPGSIDWQSESVACRCLLIHRIQSENPSQEMLNRCLGELQETYDTIKRRFADKDHAATIWPTWLAGVQQIRGQVYLQLVRSKTEPDKHRQSALDSFTAAADIQYELTTRDPANAVWLGKFGLTSRMQADLLKKLKQPDQARLVLQRALGQVQRFQEQRQLPKQLRKTQAELQADLTALGN